MDRKIAEKVLAMSMDCSRDTSESIRQVMETCDAETFRMYRRCGGRITGHIFTEIVAPIQSEHPDLAPPDFKPMQPVELPKLNLTKEAREDLLGLLLRLCRQLEATADFVHENCDEVEAAMYRSRIYQVLVHVAETIACVSAAHVEDK